MRRLAVVLLTLSSLVVAVGVETSPAATPVLTRLRIVLSKSDGADYASLRIPDTYLKPYYVAAHSVGATISRGKNTLMLKGPDPASATIDAIFSVPVGVDYPELALHKSLSGKASVQVIRTNTDGIVVANFQNLEHIGDGKVSKHVTRAALVGEGLTILQLDPRKLVLAFYYPWFKEGSFSNGLWYDEPASAYETGDPAAVATMVNEAANAGINGFVLSWGENKASEFDVLLQAASGRPGFAGTFTIGIEGKDGFDINAVTASTLTGLERAAHPSFLRSVDGRPVVFVFGSFNRTPEEWLELRSRIAAAGHNPFYVGDSANPEFDYDGVYLYNPNLHSDEKIAYVDRAISNALRLPPKVNPNLRQRLWAASVSPGMNDMYKNPFDYTSRPRNNGKRYDVTWKAALATAPEWILVTTWNEWYEATHIAPSDKFGTQALDQTRSWSAYYRNPTQSVPSQPSPGLPVLGSFKAKELI